MKLSSYCPRSETLTNDRWHNDIKPENIIAVDDNYKLADPGFAKFQKKLEDRDSDPIPKCGVDGGTITYGE